MSKYSGTQTEKNLEAAFAGESQARNKYTYFASVAKKQGFEQISALFLKDGIKGFKAKMDSTTRGGAPLLGIAKPVIKAHGNSNPVAFKNAIKQAKIFVETDINGTISSAIAKMKEDKAE